INYIALSGALAAIGPEGGAPVPPLNLVGDFGGGALYLAFGIMCAVWEAARSGKGQVVDVSMVEGAASLMTGIYGLHAAGVVNTTRGANILDGGAHFYGVYETKDGAHVALGAIEAKFYELLIERLGLAGGGLPDQMDRGRWPEMRRRIAAVIKTRTREEWRRQLEGTDVCFAPVLNMDEAPQHPHNRARESFVEVDGVVQPGPAPKFSRTKPRVQSPPPAPGADTESALADWGFGADEIEQLKRAGAVGWQAAAEAAE
ncbi:MAG: CaiB/BaiF CoA transferase family protein, partial [Alphaproteobacteria bacterium]